MRHEDLAYDGPAVRFNTEPSETNGQSLYLCVGEGRSVHLLPVLYLIEGHPSTSEILEPVLYLRCGLLGKPRFLDCLDVAEAMLLQTHQK